MGEMEAASTSAARVSRGLPFPGRRRERAAGERIAALFEEHGRMVYGVCRLLLRDAVEAEDAAQQTFLSAYRALLAGQEPREPSAWLGTIARNVCRSRLRARRTEPLTLVTEPVGDELQREVTRRQEVEALCAALAELPPQQRDAVVLREFYGLSYAEVAAALGLSGAAVESLLFRSRKRLQEQLRPVRSALGVLALPVSLQESLAQALPGFGGGASAGAGAALLGKLASAPVVAKVAALTLAVGTVGTVADVERGHRAGRHGVAPPPAAVLAPPAPTSASAAETPRARTVSFVVAQRTVSTPTRVTRASAPRIAEPEHESAAPSREIEHQRVGSSPETEHAGSTGTGHESQTGSHDSGSHDSGSTGATGASGETEHSGSSGETVHSGDTGTAPPPGD